MDDEKIWGRVVTKKEEKQLKRDLKLLAAEEGQLVPVFDATNHLAVLPERKKDIKLFHKYLGCSGAGDRIALFETKERPFAGPINLRKIPWLKEYKFKSGTEIYNLRIK